MPIIHVDIRNSIFEVYRTLPKQVRGKFVDAALAHFMKTSEGQAIIDFNRIGGMKAPEIQPTSSLNTSHAVDEGYPDLDGWDNLE